MKKIFWSIFGRDILFNLNWIEYFILKRIIRKNKYHFLNEKELRGEYADMMVFDEELE